ncbi:MAG: hypothetical protein CBC55_09035 [Gammaproteobacteria bacterium TMED95]|nr:MAG: hypothetical protein CBC55_09035 [Gammaproteobacteria bacterium TMED95]|tara:strand:+ start:5032 stop:5313 length:282 start_codon:yes stop_codon:yes gene_type:complete
MNDINITKFLATVQKGLVDVRFEKADGTQTNRKVTLSPDWIPSDQPGVQQPEYEDLLENKDAIMDKDYLRVYSATDQGWRTIKPSKLISWIGS